MDDAAPMPMPAEAAIEDMLARQARMGTLRLLTCGSVDDGKSTLIGRLLYDSKRLLDDQLAALVRESARQQNHDGELDFALLVDGLQAEREQGITIDVAYRYFATDRRRFIVADAPGHEQYTRNMATAASNAELAVLLVDARRGVLTQTRRHSFIAALMGIRHVVLAVNKIDLVGFSEQRFKVIVEDFARAVDDLGFATLMAIPTSARLGDNVTHRSEHTVWYGGPSLLDFLETIELATDAAARPFRMPVQWVTRADAELRGYCGTVASGRLRVGERIEVAQPHERAPRGSEVARIICPDGDASEAQAGAAVTLVLRDHLDISRGDVLGTGTPVVVTDTLDANLVWLNETELFVGRNYLFKLGTRSIPGTVTRIRHRIDIASFEPVAAHSLAMNDVARVAIALGAPVAVERFSDNRDLGGFIVIDRASNATVGVGMVVTATPVSSDIAWQRLTVDKRARAALKGQRPVAIWFTGLSGSGKSTIANLIEQRLHALGRHTTTLDGDNVRHGLNRDLGFGEADRVENIRRAAEVARLMVDAGLIVLLSFISPYASDRGAARERFESGDFLEVFVDTPLDECRRRDPKGLYRRAEAGLIRNFTGIDAPYEAPTAPDIHLPTLRATPEQLAERVIAELHRRGILAPG
jgi:bifunctional enzyme CysN/CysC